METTTLNNLIEAYNEGIINDSTIIFGTTTACEVLDWFDGLSEDDQEFYGDVSLDIIVEVSMKEDEFGFEMPNEETVETPGIEETQEWLKSL